MTKNQILKLLKQESINMAYNLDVRKNEVEIFVDGGNGRADEEQQQTVIEKVRKVLPWLWFTCDAGKL